MVLSSFLSFRFVYIQVQVLLSFLSLVFIVVVCGVFIVIVLLLLLLFYCLPTMFCGGEVKRYGKKCCVPGCETTSGSMYRFPNKKEMFLAGRWLDLIKNPELRKLPYAKVYENRRVCFRHFLPEEFEPEGSKRGLKRGTIPSLHLPDCTLKDSIQSEVQSSIELFEPQTVQKPRTEVDPVQILDVNMEGEIEDSVTKISTLESQHVDSIDSEPSTSKRRKLDVIDHREVSPRVSPIQCQSSEQSPDKRNITVNHCFTPKRNKMTFGTRQGILRSVNVSRQKDLTPRARRLYKSVVDTSNKLARVTSKMTSFKARLKEAQKCANSQQFKTLMDHVNLMTYHFIMSQVRSQKQKPKARRFSIEEKLISLMLLKASGRGYKLLSKIFTLPTKQTLVRLLNRIPLKPGINSHMFESLKENISKMKNIDKYAILTFDEMSIESTLYYNSSEDEIVGVEDMGNGERKPELADHVNVFMLKGVFKQWKQPICYTFSGGPTKTFQIKKLIKDVIRESTKIGVTVIATVCDQGGPNQAAINALLRDTKNVTETQNCFGFVVDNLEIVPLYDTPHLFKGIRNNLLTKDLHFKMNGKQYTASWKHIEQVYFADIEDQHRLLNKLTDQHVLRNKINKMKVKCCTQVFSNQVGCLMMRMVKWNSQANINKEMVETAELILFLDSLFDSLNSSHKSGPPGKPMKASVTKESKHIQYWYDAIKIFESMKYYCAIKKKFTIVPSLKNMITTLKGFIYLCQKMHKVYPQRYILTRPFQQDALENFFGCVRSYCARENMPNAARFITCFKALLINNFTSAHSPGANCEEDTSEGPLYNLKKFITGEIEPEVNVSSDIPQPDIPAVITAYKGSKLSRCISMYISGFIARRLLKKIKCDNCRKNILAVNHINSNIDTDFIEARQYPNSQLITPGSYFNFLITQSVSRLYYVIPRVCHYTKISLFLHKVLLKDELKFHLLNCKNHDITHTIIELVVTYSLYFWCRRVNLVCKGQDEKFIKLLKLNPNKSLVDPIKLLAFNKNQSKIKRNKKHKQKLLENQST